MGSTVMAGVWQGGAVDTAAPRPHCRGPLAAGSPPIIWENKGKAVDPPQGRGGVLRVGSTRMLQAHGSHQEAGSLDGLQDVAVLDDHLVRRNEGVKLVLPLALGQPRLPLESAHHLRIPATAGPTLVVPAAAPAKAAAAVAALPTVLPRQRRRQRDSSTMAAVPTTAAVAAACLVLAHLA